MGTLDRRVAVITGGASGIGRATAELFAAEGAAVVIGDVQEATETVAAITAHGGTASFVRTDVSDSSQVAELIAAAERRHDALNIVVCAAGIGGGSAPTAEYSEADFDRVLAVNLKGVFLAMKHGIPAVLRGGGGAIITVASITALVGLPRTPAYSAAKGGVLQLTRTAALEYATRHVRVNCICPGMIDTPMARGAGAAAREQFIAWQPLGRLGRADEIAAAALFLASDDASFVTGAALLIDGGFTAQ